jgi:type IV fimbrial biogenesis protein FimT
MKQNKGFTLIELVITIAIGAIVLTMGIPSFQNVILNNRLITQTNTLIGALTLARTEAIKNGTFTTICASDDGATCGDNWAKGWMVFSSRNGDTKVDPGDDVWLVNDGLKGGNTLKYDYEAITFNAKGLIEGVTNDTFKLCDAKRSGLGRLIIVARTGRARVEKEPGGKCS